MFPRCTTSESAPDSSSHSSRGGNGGCNDGDLIYRPKTTFHARVLTKEGNLNVHNSEIPQKYRRYIKDLSNTLINTRWRWILLALTTVNALAWLAFAFAWQILATFSGDFSKTDAIKSDVCIVGTRHFTGYLLLSIETLTTIGSGEIYPANCVHSWSIVGLQALIGVAIEGTLVTMVYVKMSRPLRRVKAFWSKKGVICLRDNRFCLVFRIHDHSGRFWTKGKIRAFLVANGPSISKCLPSVAENSMWKLQLQACELLAGPVDVVHVVTSDSPLWTLSAVDFLSGSFEIVLTVNGDSVTTGHPSEAKKSYTNRDIHWGRRFVPCVDFDERGGSFVVDSNRFNSTRMYDTPLCSPAELQDLLEAPQNA